MNKVEVFWLDAWGDSAEVKQARLDAMEPVPRSDVGYLKSEDNEKVVLVGGNIHWSKISGEEDAFHNEQVIPKRMIVRIIPQKDGD